MADPAPERAAGVLWTAALVLLTAVYVVWSEVVCLAKWSVHVCVIGAVRAVYDEWPDAGPQRRRRALIVTVALCMMLMCGMWLVAWGAGTHALKGGHVTAGGRDVVEMVVARAAAEKQGFVASRRRRGEAPLSMSGAAGSSDNGMDGWFGACFATARAWLGAGAATLSGAVVPAVLCSFGAGLVVCDLLLSVTILGEVERRWPQRTACIVRYLDVVGLEFGFVPARAPLLARRGHIFLHEERVTFHRPGGTVTGKVITAKYGQHHSYSVAWAGADGRPRLSKKVCPSRLATRFDPASVLKRPDVLEALAAHKRGYGPVSVPMFGLLLMLVSAPVLLYKLMIGNIEANPGPVTGDNTWLLGTQESSSPEVPFQAIVDLSFSQDEVDAFVGGVLRREGSSVAGEVPSVLQGGGAARCADPYVELGLLDSPTAATIAGTSADHLDMTGAEVASVLDGAVAALGVERHLETGMLDPGTAATITGIPVHELDTIGAQVLDIARAGQHCHIELGSDGLRMAQQREQVVVTAVPGGGGASIGQGNGCNIEEPNVLDDAVAALGVQRHLDTGVLYPAAAATGIPVDDLDSVCVQGELSVEAARRDRNRGTKKRKERPKVRLEPARTDASIRAWLARHPFQLDKADAADIPGGSGSWCQLL
ncbi:hypothetical protein N2152v2_005677 [Parachlorella kessleri]